jgi:peroxiredoxin
MAVYLRMQKDPQVPENLVYKNPELSREFILNRYKYSKAHYFDNIPFSDIRILRTRLIFEKLDHYFNYFISQDADSLISAMNNVIILSKVNEESLHFTLNFLNINYRNPKNPSQEKAFVYLADNYYLDGNSKWADANFLKLLKIKVDNLRTTMIGNTAPDLELNASNGKTVKVHDIQSDYLVIYFWSPDCNECKTETPELFNFYDKYKNKGLKVIAVYTHTDKEIWNAYLNDHKFDWINAYDPLLKSNFTKLYNVKNIPKLFLLDKDKRILAKDINISQLELLFRKKIKE